MYCFQEWFGTTLHLHLKKGATQTMSDSKEWNKVFIYHDFLSLKNECDQVKMSVTKLLCHTHFHFVTLILLTTLVFTFSHSSYFFTQIFTLSNSWKSGYQKQNADRSPFSHLNKILLLLSINLRKAISP